MTIQATIKKMQRLSEMRPSVWSYPLALSLTTSLSVQAAESRLDQVDEIMVTAQKYEQRLQDVPNSISVMTGEQLQQQGATSLADYLQRIPGASFSEVPSGARTGVQITINGIANQRVFNANVDTAAALTSAVYIDDVYIVPVDPSIYDLARVEVLKGPQGTLFGQAAMGGAVKFVTNQPDSSALKVAGDLMVATPSGGSPSFGANGMINLPLATDKLAVRLSASQREDGGWIDFRAVNLNTGTTSITGPSVKEDFNTVKSQSGRVTLRYTPTENLSITPSIFWQSRERVGESAFNKELRDGAVREGYFAEPRQEDFYVGSLTVKYALPKFDITSVTGYTERQYIGAQDTTAFFVTVYGKNPDGTIPGPNALIMDNTSNIFTQELRLQSNRDWFDWLQMSVGATYNRENVDANTIWEAEEWNGGATEANRVPSGHFSLSYADTEYTNKSAYADGEVFFGKFSAGAGIRYSEQQGEYNGISSGAALPVTWNKAVGRTLEERRSTPRYYVSYKPNDDFLIYSSVAKGFRLGGAGSSNYQANLTPECTSTLQSLGLGSYDGSYGSDEVTNYSVGAKTSWLQNRVQLNTDFFYIEWDELQSVLNLNQINSACNLSLTTNAGDATSRGVNTELRTSFGAFDFSAALAYTEAKRGVPPQGVTAYREDDPLGGVPEWSGSFSGQYNWMILDGRADAFLRLDFASRSSMLTPDFTDPRDPWQKMAAYERFNIRLGAQGQTYGVTLFMDNVLNDVSELGGGHAFGMADVWRVLVMPPRTTGVRVEARF